MSDRVLVTTVPFGDPDPASRNLLEQAGVDYEVQPLGRRLTEDELADMAGAFAVLIAGTEPITAKVMDAAPHLRLISRVGIGLDGVDLLAARERGIAVAYTPDAPSAAVAELTIGLMLSLCRGVLPADRSIRNGTWKRIMGRRLEKSSIGVIGVGRIGSRVLRALRGAFPGAHLMGNDLVVNEALGEELNVDWVEKEELYATSDVISLHVPLTRLTRNMIGARELRTMKRNALLVNTARGGVVVEKDLVDALRDESIAAAAVDVFEAEPYEGDLKDLQNCVLTCHMGSMTRDGRVRMEVEASEEAVRWLRGEPLKQPVPESEYDLRTRGG